jgi:hypothetical protein
MKFHILIAQRKCRYQGEYAPEALEVIDEYAMDENPEWYNSQFQKHIDSGDFCVLKTMTISVPDAEIDNILDPPETITRCEIIDTNKDNSEDGENENN